MAAVTALKAQTGCASPSKGPGCLAWGPLCHGVAMGTWSGCCERTVWVAPGGLLPSAQELHLHFSPWPRPFLELHCSCDPSDPDALCWLHPRPVLSPWMAPSHWPGGWTRFLSPDLFLLQWDCNIYSQTVPLPTSPSASAASLPALAEHRFLFASPATAAWTHNLRDTFLGTPNLAPKIKSTQWKTPSTSLAVLQNVKTMYRWILNNKLKE